MSASVTGDLSALMRTSILCWYIERAIEAACLPHRALPCSSGEGFMNGLRFVAIRHLIKTLCYRRSLPRSYRIMGNRLSKIYTRTGDDGSTGLGDGARVPRKACGSRLTAPSMRPTAPSAWCWRLPTLPAGGADAASPKCSTICSIWAASCAFPVIA